jgi:hypothetical protein
VSARDFQKVKPRLFEDAVVPVPLDKALGKEGAEMVHIERV